MYSHYCFFCLYTVTGKKICVDTMLILYGIIYITRASTTPHPEVVVSGDSADTTMMTIDESTERSEIEVVWDSFDDLRYFENPEASETALILFSSLFESPFPLFEALKLPRGSLDFVGLVVYLFDSVGYTVGLMDALQYWNLFGGSALMTNCIESMNDDLSCIEVDNKLYALFLLITCLGHTDGEIYFANVTGLTLLCTNYSEILIAWIKKLHSTQFPLFVMYLPKYCPTLFTDIDMVRISLVHRIWRPSNVSSVWHVRRDHVFQDSLVWLESDALFGPIAISFIGEEGVGDGVTRDWFSELARQIFISPNWLNEHSPRHLNAIGIFIALSIQKEIPIGPVLSVAFCGFLMDLSVTLEDIEYEDPVLFRSISTLDELDDVTDQDISDMLQVSPEKKALLEHVRTGFLKVIPLTATRNYLTPKDLHDIIAGNPIIDGNDLILNCELTGFRFNSWQMIWLVRLLARWDTDMQVKFLRFFTGLTRLPFGGFGALNPKAGIRKTDSTQGSFPTAQTCHHTLNLPAYDSFETMKIKLETAIHSDMNFSFT